MQVLAALPDTILDGESVLPSGGVPNLEAMLARHQLRQPAKIQHGSQHQSVTYVVFDLLAHQGRSLVGQPLQIRRILLQDLLARWQEARAQFSEGLVRPGRLFFDQAVRQGQEGIMAEHVASRYLPATSSACWLKIKPTRQMPCAIMGWQQGACGLRGLLLAAPCKGGCAM
jgi:bifunctional non-homologous end joining protein LigD